MSDEETNADARGAAGYVAAKIAIFIASLIAAALGTIITYPCRREEGESETRDKALSVPDLIPVIREKRRNYDESGTNRDDWREQN